MYYKMMMRRLIIFDRLMVRPGELVVIQRGMRFKVGSVVLSI